MLPLLLANQLFSHAEQVNAPAQHDLPYRLMDLHVHTTDEFTIEDVVAVGKKTGFNLAW